MIDWKRAFAAAHYRLSGRKALPRPGGRILLYHSVHPRLADGFAAQLEALQSHYRVLPLSEFLAELPSSRVEERPAIALTFDDGYRDNYEVAYPLLRRAGLSAAFFVVSSMPAATAAEREATPAPPPGGWSGRLFLTWEELREMLAGGMEIGLHSHRHANLASLTPEAFEADLTDNIGAVTERLGVEPVAYAVPFGRRRHYPSRLPAALVRRGIRYALSATHGWNHAAVSPYHLHRDAVQPDYELQYLWAILHGCFDWIR